MDLSIVIPAFNESKKVGTDIEAASAFLQSNHLAGEIIIVDDGSEDGTSEAARGVTVGSSIRLEVIRCEEHRGKGCAVRTGIAKACGEYVMFADSGCCVPYGYIAEGLKLLKGGACDMAHGSRKLAASKIQRPQSWYRRICGSLFRWAVHRTMRITSGLSDTQCGFKIYRGDVARDLYGQCFTNGFMFDLEIIVRAEKRGYRIEEFPIEWTCDRNSRLSPTRSLWCVLRELMTIKRTLAKENS